MAFYLEDTLLGESDAPFAVTANLMISLILGIWYILKLFNDSNSLSKGKGPCQSYGQHAELQILIVNITLDALKYIIVKGIIV